MKDSLFERFVSSGQPGWLIARTVFLLAPIIAGLILGIMVSKKLVRWVKTYVNVGDYREKREETLMHMAQRAAERALSLGRPVELMRLTPAERRIVHLTLSGDERIETESVGEGDDRVLLVKPK